MPVRTLASVLLALSTCPTLRALDRPPVFGLQFSPDGRYLAAASGAKGSPGPITVWATDDWSVHFRHQPTAGSLHVDFSPDNRLLAFGTRGGRVGVLDIASGNLLHEFELHNGLALSASFSPLGDVVVSSGSDKSIKLISIETGEVLRSLEGHSEWVYAAAISRDGQTLVSGGRDNQTMLWNLRTGEVKKTFTPSDLIVRRVRFSRDGNYFLESRWDAKVRIRETKTGRLRALLVGGSDCADMTADNRHVVTSGYGSTAYVFDVALSEPSDGVRNQIAREIARFASNSYQVREAAAAAILEIGMIAEAPMRSAMESADAEVRVRARRTRQELMSPEPIAKLGGHTGDVEVVCFSSDGRLIATGCRGGDVKVWDARNYSELIALDVQPESGEPPE